MYMQILAGMLRVSCKLKTHSYENDMKADIGCKEVNERVSSWLVKMGNYMNIRNEELVHYRDPLFIMISFNQQFQSE
jgi:hypothetical protein